MKALSVFTLALMLRLPAGAVGEIYETNHVMVSTFAGSGNRTWKDGQGTNASFGQFLRMSPLNLTADSQGNVFVADNPNYCIRKITPDGTVKTIAGLGRGTIPDYGTNVSFGRNIPDASGTLRSTGYTFSNLQFDRLGALWILASIVSYSASTSSYSSSFSTGSYCLVRISGPENYVSVTEFRQLAAPLASAAPSGLCFDSSNNLYISTSSPISNSVDNRIYRRRMDGVWEVFAGSGKTVSRDGIGTNACFAGPRWMAVDAADNLCVYDWNSKVLRRIKQNGEVSTIVGTGGDLSDRDGPTGSASIGPVYGLCVDDWGNVYLANRAAVRKVSASGNVTTMAGAFLSSGYTNGPGRLARFASCGGICFAQGALFVGDAAANWYDPTGDRIRQLTFEPRAETPVAPGLTVTTDTGPAVQLTGSIGRVYGIESSADLVHWVPETKLLLTHNPYVWPDTNGAAGPKKFYRGFVVR